MGDWKDEGIEDVSLGLVHWSAWLPRPLEEVWQASILGLGQCWKDHTAPHAQG